MKFTPAVARYEQVARDLRRRLLGGEWAPDVTLPGAPAVAREYGVTQSVAQRAMETLVSWRLARTGTGRGTVATRLHGYRAEVTIPWTSGTLPAEATGALQQALDAAREGDELIGAVEVQPAGPVGLPGATVVAVVTAAHAGHAADRLMELARGAAGAGWDITAATATAWPS